MQQENNKLEVSTYQRANCKQAATRKPEFITLAAHTILSLCQQESRDGGVTADLCVVATACTHGRNCASSTAALEVCSVPHSSAAVCLV